MGRIGAPFGVRGWVRVIPYTSETDGLARYPHWWIGDPAGRWHRRRVESCEMRPNGVFAKLAGCDDRASAEALTHREIAVERRELPELGDDEIYWADLLGYQVVNLQDEVLGHVDGLIETPANDVMVVRQHDGAERLLPAVEAVVIEVDAEARQVRVDWGRDY